MASIVLEAVSFALEDILAVDGAQRSAKKYNFGKLERRIWTEKRWWKFQ